MAVITIRGKVIAGGNCGTGAGGFKGGNTCAKGGDGESEDVTDTAEFKEWFGDSKIVDERGNPLVVYHGTKVAFEEFDTKKFGASDEGLVGKGFYFTYNREEAAGYAANVQFGAGDVPNVISAYVSIQNPFVIKHVVLPNGRHVHVLPDGRNLRDLHEHGINSKGGNEVRQLAEDASHDGIVFVSRDGQVRHVVPFRSEQIKSAAANRGTFDKSDPNIFH